MATSQPIVAILLGMGNYLPDTAFSALAGHLISQSSLSHREIVSQRHPFFDYNATRENL
jgi:hypothetical protein